MMNKRSEQELREEIYPRYLKAGKAEKTKILDEFTAATGYHRKYAIKLLNHSLKRKGYKKVGRKKRYQGEVIELLEKIWETWGGICSKRLHPFIPEIENQWRVFFFRLAWDADAALERAFPFLEVVLLLYVIQKSRFSAEL